MAVITPHKLHRTMTEEGIYFGMPDNVYHNDSAISRGNIVDILKSPNLYWRNSYMNALRKKYKKDALQMGAMKHCLLLEPEKFPEQYRVLGLHGYAPGRAVIKPSEWDKVKEAVEIVRADEYASIFFEHGYPEVAFFVREPSSGIMLRCKVDYLTPFSAIDYKTIRTIDPEKMKWDIADHGYDIQDQHYSNIISMSKDRLRDGTLNVYGDVDKKFVKEFIDEEVTEFRFVYQESMEPFRIRVEKNDESLARNAAVNIVNALDIWDWHITHYGEDKWPECKPVTHQRTLDDMPYHIQTRGNHIIMHD